MSRPCLLAAWSTNEASLRAYLRHRIGDADDADELMQELFLKAIRQGELFCRVENPRAWLFQVARNALADRLRLRHEYLPLPDDLAIPASDGLTPVDELSQCLPRVLSELAEADRQAIRFCDIDGHSQQALADLLGLSLSVAKSRLQRARRRLKQQLETACQVEFDETGAVSGFTPRPPLPGR